MSTTGRLSVDAFQRLQEFETAHARQLEIRDNKIERFSLE